MNELIAKAQAGDRAALEQLLREIAPAVRRFGMHMCRNGADAQDVLQDTLMAVADHLDQYAGRASLSSWVFMLARTACARRRRGRKNQPAAGDEQLVNVETHDAGPEHTAEQRQLSALVTRALGQLSAEHREVIALRDVEGLSADETAEALGISTQAVKSRLHRAREALRVRLAEVLEPHAQRRPPTCPDVAAMFSRKLEDELTQQDCARMEAHLAGCPYCEQTCHALRDVLSACQAERGAAPSPEVQAAIRATLARLAQGG
ncbi:MAG TPA: RNA polymerase sigma factor [Polyangiales bacterium]